MVQKRTAAGLIALALCCLAALNLYGQTCDPLPVPRYTEAVATDSASTIFIGTERGVFYSTDGGNSWAVSDSGLPHTPYSRILSLAVDPHTRAIYAGDNGGGVSRSADGGRNWKIVNTGMPKGDLMVNALAINPSGHIFSGTNLGVYRSTNGGNSWEGLTKDFTMSLAITPSGHIFAGTWSNGIWRSIDNGDTWTQVNNGLTVTERITAIVASGDTLYAGTSAGIEGGVFRSTNNGDSWTRVLGENNLFLVYDIEISAGEVFASVVGGVYRSTDGGESWTKTGLANRYALDLAISKDGDLYAGCNAGKVFSTTDGGKNWTQLDLTNPKMWKPVNQGFLGPWHELVYSMALNPASGDIFAATLGAGVFQTSDLGQNWVAVNSGLREGYILSMTSNNKGHLYAGTDIIHRSTDNGNTWEVIGQLPELAPAYDMAVSPTNNHLFVGTYYGVWRWDGANWRQFKENFASTYISSIAVNRQGHVFAGTYMGGVYRSTDNGNSWMLVTPWKHLDVGIGGAIVFNSQGHIFVSTLYSGGIWRSTDGGDTWTRVHTRGGSALLIDGDDVILAATDQGVEISRDNGATWKVITGDINHGVMDFAIHPSGNVFAGTYGSGVFRTACPRFNGVYPPPTSSCNFEILSPQDSASVCGDSVEIIVSADSLMGPQRVHANGFPLLKTQDGFRGKIPLFKGKPNYIRVDGTTLDSKGEIACLEQKEIWIMSTGACPKPQIPPLKVKGLIQRGGILQHVEYKSDSLTVKVDSLELAGARGFAQGGSGNPHTVTNEKGDHRHYNFVGGVWHHQKPLYGLAQGEVVLSMTIPNRGMFIGTNVGNVYFVPNNGVIELAVKTGLSIDGLTYDPLDPNRFLFGFGQRLCRIESNGRITELPVQFDRQIGGLAVGADSTLYVSFSEAGSPNIVALNPVNFEQEYEIDFGIEAYVFGIIVEPVALSKSVGSGDEEHLAPANFQLHQNYPNPFNPSTTIRFSLPEASLVTLRVYNALGQTVAELVNGILPAGTHTTTFEASHLASGLYFYRLQVNGKVAGTQKMHLLK